jgi:uncharacterized protein YciI
MSARVFLSLFENLARPTPEAIEKHVAYLRDLDDRGRLLVCGPFRAGDRGIVCFMAATDEEADRIAREDPFVVLGFKRYRLHEVERATRENGYLLGE